MATDHTPRSSAGAEQEAAPGASGHKGPPAIVTPSTKVTVAFPFSTVTVHESSETMIELAALVAELARVVDGGAGGDGTAEGARLAERADALVERLRRAR